jgi:hypothetical protein
MGHRVLKRLSVQRRLRGIELVVTGGFAEDGSDHASTFAGVTAELQSNESGKD